MNKYAFPLLASALLAFLAPHRVEAGIILYATESGSSVVFSFSGSIDLTGAPDKSSSSSPSYINPGVPALAFETATGSGAFDNFNLPLNTRVPFGSGGGHNPTSVSGDHFNFSGHPTSPYLGLPVGYVSGTSISGTMTFSGQTLASLGITPGYYVYDVTFAGLGAVSQTVALSASVPEPGTLFLSSLGLVGGAAAALRRRMKSRAKKSA
jgi:hypothetical protein